jgi:hypothetical protein
MFSAIDIEAPPVSPVVNGKAPTKGIVGTDTNGVMGIAYPVIG